VCDLLLLLPSDQKHFRSVATALTATPKTREHEALIVGLLTEKNHFRLRYNVQTLCSLLLPLDDTQSFLDAFVRLGGVRLLCGCVASLKSRLADAKGQHLRHWCTSVKLCLELLHTVLAHVEGEDRSSWVARTTAQLESCDVPASLVRFSDLFWAAAMGRLGDSPENDEGAVQVGVGGEGELAVPAGKSGKSGGGSGGDGQLSSMSSTLALKTLQVLLILLEGAGEMQRRFLEGASGWTQLRDVLLNSPSAAVRAELCRQLVHLAESSPGALEYLHRVALEARELAGMQKHPESLFEMLCSIYPQGIEAAGDAMMAENHLASELEWLAAHSADGRRADAATADGAQLLAGHLKLCTVIVRMCPTRKPAVLEALFATLFRELLFPASDLLHTVRAEGGSAWIPLAQRLPGPLHHCARVPAYDLLVELCVGSADALTRVVEELTRLHLHAENRPPELECVLSLNRWHTDVNGVAWL
jgi:hypothetical protein